MSDKINAVKTMTIRLDPLTSKHLDELVKRQHRTRTKIIRQLISAAALGLVTKEETE